MNSERLAQWGTNLATARRLRGYTVQAAFAEELGVAQQSVSKWENGESAPRDDMKLHIARVLKVPVGMLFPLEEQAS